MFRNTLAFTCLTLSISANAATVTYTATEANVTPGSAGFIGTFVYDDVAHQVISSDLVFSDLSAFSGFPPGEVSIYASSFALARYGGQHASEHGQIGTTLFVDNSFSYTGKEYSNYAYQGAVSGTFDAAVVPLPAAAWLFISALGGLVVAKRKQLKA